MSNVSLSLIVLRSPDIVRSAAFYSRLGLQFSLQRHGSGPEHFSAELAGGSVGAAGQLCVTRMETRWS